MLNFAIRRPANHAVLVASSHGIEYYDETQHDEAQHTYRKRTPQTAAIEYSNSKEDKTFVLYEQRIKGYGAMSPSALRTVSKYEMTLSKHVCY